jgi:flagellar motor switch protein FliM
MTRANSQLADVINAFGLELTIQFDDCATAWPIDTLQEWSDKAVAFRVKLPRGSAVSMIAVPNPLAQILIGILLGEQPTAWPTDRDLTPAEESVGQFLVGKIAESLSCTWTGDSAIDLQLFQRESNLRRSRCFRFREPFVVCRATMTTSLGAGQWCWMLSHEFLNELFGKSRGARKEVEKTPRQQLESIAREMTTHVTIRLGSVPLTAPQLAALRVGDLIVLGQKTTEPLKAMVSGKPRFLGWPGRVGTRQAFEIATDGAHPDRFAKPAETTKQP